MIEILIILMKYQWFFKIFLYFLGASQSIPTVQNKHDEILINCEYFWKYLNNL